MSNWDDYVWIVVVGSFAAFFTAFGIGANDVANAFATSVGSRALTLTQAVLIAAIFEFGGAVLLGAQVTDTVRKKIADKDKFKEDPEVLMYGMLCVLFATGLWLLLASYAELPVSTTHSVIGGIIGMAMVAKGSGAVVWGEFDDSKEALKKFSGVAPVVVSWVVSPVCAAIFSVTIFLFTRQVILRSQNPFGRTMIFFPILVGATVMVNAYFILLKGFKRKINGESLDDLMGNHVHTVAWGAAAFSGLVVHLTVIPYLKRIVPERARATAAAAAAVTAGQSRTGLKEGLEESAAAPATEQHKTGLTMLDYDVHAPVRTDGTVEDIHVNAEVFDAETEEAFKYLQVFTAMMDSFAHGANDVANSIGPFAAIYEIYREQSVESKADVPVWILVLGGAGIVVGLATYGYKIISAIGVKLVKISATRGFAIELGSACIIILGSRYGLPLSTTHCQVGSTVGVGLMEGRAGRGVNGLLFLKVLSGWLLTLAVVGLTAAAFMAQGVYAPSIVNLNEITRYRNGVGEAIKTMNTALSPPLGDESDLIGKEAPQTDISEGLIALLRDTTKQVLDTCP